MPVFLLGCYSAAACSVANSFEPDGVFTVVMYTTVYISYADKIPNEALQKCITTSKKMFFMVHYMSLVIKISEEREQEYASGLRS